MIMNVLGRLVTNSVVIDSSEMSVVSVVEIDMLLSSMM